MALITCETCKKEYSDKLDACLHCGEPRAKNLYGQSVSSLQTPHQIQSPPPPRSGSNFSKILSGIFSIIVLAALCYNIYMRYINKPDSVDAQTSVNSTTGSTNSNPVDSNVNPVPEKDYANPSIPTILDNDEYRKAVFSKYPIGQKVLFMGKVTQINDDGGYDVTLCDNNDSDCNASNSDAVVYFKSKPQIMLGDFVQIKGRFKGVEQYKIEGKSNVDMALFYGDYYDTTNSNTFFNGITGLDSAGIPVNPLLLKMNPALLKKLHDEVAEQAKSQATQTTTSQPAQVGTDTSQSTKVDHAEYCAQVKLGIDTAGKQGWPDYQHNFGETCPPDTSIPPAVQ